ncbi:hypothetical protein H6F89_31360 [Cyanobacteria bacterium FACHB-63]|nr:hypothetical protein [Cyanobacteria bacterium FACHB-63]
MAGSPTDVLVLERSGVGLKDMTEKVSRTIGLVVPNQQKVRSKPWK